MRGLLALIGVLAIPAPSFAQVQDPKEIRRLFIEVEEIRRLPQKEQGRRIEHLYRDAFPILNPVFYSQGFTTQDIPDDLQKLEPSELAEALMAKGGWHWLHHLGRTHCIETLRNHRDALAPFVKSDFDSQDEKTIRRALDVTAELRLTGFFDDTLNVYRKNKDLRPYAENALRALDDPRAIRPLIEGDPEFKDVFLMDVLRSISKSKPADPALTKLLESKDSNIRWRATYALSESGDASLVSTARKLFRDTEPKVRQNAAGMAFNMPAEAFTKLRADLVDLLSDNDPMVRFQVSAGFAYRRDPICAPSLLSLLREGSLEGGYNSSVVQNVQTVTGSYFGYDMSQPPKAEVNQAALARFETWIKEHPATEGDSENFGFPESFTGEVDAGQAFERQLKSGLWFQLRPGLDGGYIIWLGDKAHPEEDYCSVVTPPFHGPNALNIWASELASEDYARLNNRPGRTREFKFVADRASYQEADWAIHRVLWPPPTGEPSDTAEKAQRLYDQYQKSSLRGSLVVKDVQLDNPSGANPKIKHMRFEVSLLSGDLARPSIKSKPWILELKIEVASKGKLAYHLINNGQVGVAFGVMTCGQAENWSMNTAAVKLLLTDVHGCDKNYCDTHVVQPKGSLDGVFPYALQNGGKPPSAIRLHFKSCTGTYPGKSLPIQDIWSNPLTIEDFGG